jgi:hypothetical protein
MLVFRSIILWLAFLFILISQFITLDTVRLLLFYRITPAVFLFIWVFSTLFFNKKLVVDTSIHGVKVLKWIKWLRLSSSVLITVGAAIKIMSWDYGDIFLMIGIGSMAAYSSLLAYVAKAKHEHNPDVIDDI